QMVVNSIDFGMNVAEATNAPRFHHQWLPDELRVEKGFSPDTLGLPDGVAPQRYLFSSGKYQYSLMLESGSDRQTLALCFAPGL
ncbi:gamma-glutamyltransferase, partial [Salmonella enterica subsp. enterica serovar Cerro]|nr:gamma-glutamyltransferase [Salmonella enterica subsp. enterica serovar Cerro]